MVGLIEYVSMNMDIDGWNCNLICHVCYCEWFEVKFNFKKPMLRFWDFLEEHCMISRVTADFLAIAKNITYTCYCGA